MIIRLYRAGPDHRCTKPTVFAFLERDLWRCDDCGQRWRVELIQPGALRWQPVSAWAAAMTSMRR